MSVLDNITQLKSQGKSDQEIIQSLRNQGIPPKDIQDALSQAQIKNAVQGSQTAGMEQSIMNSPNQDQEYLGETYSQTSPNQETNTYSSQQVAPQPPQEYPQQTYEQYPQDQYNYSQEYQDYPQQDSNQEYSQNYYQDPYSSQGYDTGALVDIAEQVFSEKVRKIQKALESFAEFKTLTESRIQNMENRLKRMEQMFDKLQLSILDKVGMYGKNLSSLQKEMNMMQDSFGKVAGPLLDKSKRKHKG